MFPQWTEEGSVTTCQHEEVLEEVRNALEEVLGAQKEVEENAGMILNAGSLEEAKQLYLIYQVSAESEERERRVRSRDGFFSFFLFSPFFFFFFFSLLFSFFPFFPVSKNKQIVIFCSVLRH